MAYMSDHEGPQVGIDQPVAGQLLSDCTRWRIQPVDATLGTAGMQRLQSFPADASTHGLGPNPVVQLAGRVGVESTLLTICPH